MFFSHGQVSLRQSLANGMVSPGGREKGHSPNFRKIDLLRSCAHPPTPHPRASWSILWRMLWWWTGTRWGLSGILGDTGIQEANSPNVLTDNMDCPALAVLKPSTLCSMKQLRGNLNLSSVGMVHRCRTWGERSSILEECPMPPP